jgi:hypothetical protein
MQPISFEMRSNRERRKMKDERRKKGSQKAEVIWGVAPVLDEKPIRVTAAK